MTIKELNNFPIFKANRNKILDEALNMALDSSSKGKYSL